MSTQNFINSSIKPIECNLELFNIYSFFLVYSTDADIMVGFYRLTQNITNDLDVFIDKLEEFTHRHQNLYVIVRPAVEALRHGTKPIVSIDGGWFEFDSNALAKITKHNAIRTVDQLDCLDNHRIVRNQFSDLGASFLLKDETFRYVFNLKELSTQAHMLISKEVTSRVLNIKPRFPPHGQQH